MDKAYSKRRETARVKPLTPEALGRFALRYVERFATTQAKLREYLQGKLRERGWAGEGDPPVDAVVERMAELGYVNDRVYSESKARELERRGFGPRRVAQALTAAGIEPELRADIGEGIDALRAAIAFARRKKLGPFAQVPPSPELRHKQFAALVRAGHSFETAKTILEAESEAELERLLAP